MIAAEEYENVYVVDSRSLSTGIALLAIYAHGRTAFCVHVENVHYPFDELSNESGWLGKDDLLW